MQRRELLRHLAVAGGLTLAWRAPLRGAQKPSPTAIDGLGEIHLDYDMALIDEIRASGLRGCVVTVGNPALQGPTAFDDMAQEVKGFDAHIASHPDRFLKVTRSADLDTAAIKGTIGIIYYTQNTSPVQDDVERLKAVRPRRPHRAADL